MRESQRMWDDANRMDADADRFEKQAHGLMKWYSRWIPGVANNAKSIFGNVEKIRGAAIRTRKAGDDMDGLGL